MSLLARRLHRPAGVVSFRYRGQEAAQARRHAPGPVFPTRFPTHAPLQEAA